MNPFWFFSKLTNAALFSVAAGDLLWKKFGPKPEDLVSSMGHFKRSADEFQKGVQTFIFGSDKSSENKRESVRIKID
jgi:hypothetical protein